VNQRASFEQRFPPPFESSERGDAMRPFTLCLATGMFACASRKPGPDMVARWNEQAMAVGGPQTQRTLAMMHLAMFDAVNAIEPRYSSYLSLRTPPKRALSEASAAAAAYGVLIRLVPDQAPRLGRSLANALISVHEGPEKAEALQFGDRVAQAIYKARLADHILAPGPIFTPDSTAGRYQLTTPGPSQPMNTERAELDAVRATFRVAISSQRTAAADVGHVRSRSGRSPASWWKHQQRAYARARGDRAVAH
jgi:hypothetical protein